MSHHHASRCGWDRVHDAIGDRRGAFLDVRSGDTQLARELRWPGRHITAIDRQALGGDSDRDDAVDHALPNAIEFIKGDPMAYPFGSLAFDVVTSGNAFTDESVGPEDELRRLADLVRPAGLLAIVCCCSASRARRLAKRVVPAARITRSGAGHCVLVWERA